MRALPQALGAAALALAPTLAAEAARANAFMNGALPQVAIEHGRKSIPAHDRPSIDEVENETLNGGAG